MRGDIYFPRDLSLINPNIPMVCDVRLGHPYTGRGSFRQSLLSAISREKNNKYRDLYHSRNITFVPLPISTFLGVGAEICHLLHLFATLAVTGRSHGETLSDEADLPVATSASSPEAAALGVCFSRMLKELQHGIALATLARLRGRDGFISSLST